jgi:hypothetical protein
LVEVVTVLDTVVVDDQEIVVFGTAVVQFEKPAFV